MLKCVVYYVIACIYYSCCHPHLYVYCTLPPIVPVCSSDSVDILKRLIKAHGVWPRSGLNYIRQTPSRLQPKHRCPPARAELQTQAKSRFYRLYSSLWKSVIVASTNNNKSYQTQNRIQSTVNIYYEGWSPFCV